MTSTDRPDQRVADVVARRFVGEEGPMVDPERRLAALVMEEAPLLSRSEAERWARHLAIDIVGLGPLQHLLDDPEVTDVLVNGPGVVWVERCGELVATDVIVGPGHIARSIERLVGPLGLQADRAHPIVDGRLADGTRVTVVLPPLAVDGPVLAIRRHSVVEIPLDAFAPATVVDRLTAAISGRANIVVFGPTGSGKTTLLRALAGAVSGVERIVTVEDVAELRLVGDQVVRLEARAGTADGVGRIAIRELVRVALRLRPDRIIVGEVRGAEALDMVWALSTGHSGSMSTCHARSGRDCVRRLETFALAAEPGLSAESVRAQVHDAVDLLVGVGRATGGCRRVTSLHELTDGHLRSTEVT